MKKAKTIVCVIIALLLCACKNGATRQEIPTAKSDEEAQTQPTIEKHTVESQHTDFLDPELFAQIIEKEKNYEIYSDENGRGYYYKIYDNTGNQLTESFGSWRFLGIEKVNDTLLMTKTGSGSVLFSAQYYDVESGQVSRMFSTPLGASSQLVAYFDSDEVGIKLVICNLFENADVLYEFRDEGFSPSVYTTRCQAVFSADNKTVQVTFPSVIAGDSMVTKVFPLVAE